MGIVLIVTLRSSCSLTELKVCFKRREIYEFSIFLRVKVLGTTLLTIFHLVMNERTSRQSGEVANQNKRQNKTLELRSANVTGSVSIGSQTLFALVAIPPKRLTTVGMTAVGYGCNSHQD